VSRGRRVVLIAALGLVGGGLAELLSPETNLADLVVLGAALVIGEMFELRPADRTPLPLSFAVVVVLVRAATPTEFVLIVVAAYAVTALVRVEPPGLVERSFVTTERIAEALAAGAAYRIIIESVDDADGRAAVLTALAAAAIAPIIVSDIVNRIRGCRIAPLRARAADLALVTSGMLMAVGYGGILGEGELGLWGPALFSIPLLAAWYSFELLGSTQRSFRQTVRALGTAPELGGLVRPGHVERVADLAVSMGRQLDLGPNELEQLETAALLHHLGAVCLDEPEAGRQHDPTAVAEAGATMLRASEALAPAGDIVAAEPLLHRPRGAEEQPEAALAGQILKVASAFDELTEGQDEHAAWAVEALYTGPGYVYDGRVLGGLERVLEERGVLTDRT